MPIETVEDLFIHALSDVYSAEKQLIKALPKMAKAATNKELAQGFLTHLEETEGQIERLDQIVEITGLKLKRVKCAAMEGLVEEGKEMIDEVEKGSVLDAGLIAAGQKVEHYEIATYGTLATLADQLGYSEAADMLRETLEEEKATDEKLTDLAVNGINEDAGQKQAPQTKRRAA